ncbi:hypothetical protein EMIHUDRAFT_432975 [Emiliania huxleyi CCMP1516]|uniref:PNPLA domain-containing protein n=2 Tax=Emiliania huxleyi TaxID=2903 RepID=A0A0D3I756_EMIH1|nr:hypothetical protein EMIHUDRAFT_432975 [Emiliania huxleyi CCMP1516]EOD07091.1 hypothetical protein EMIHUDRAFT_432975 [Emiliania huxleyi CCMP1516]|eukprot:XP_005759520.1 hypothetical protein EMIHUDRAFT_432975 [Emiliania huxleyi CCMP1516]
MSRPVHWSFSGAGLLGGYFVGVWERLVAGDVPSALFCPARSRFVGTSAGSFVAVACASGVSQADAADTFARLLQSVHNASPLRGALGCELLSLVRPELEALLPEDAHERCSGRVEVALVDSRSFPRLVATRRSTFESRSDLVDACLASAYLPGITSSAHPAPTHFSGLLDGGILDNFPRGSEPGSRTIIVSPFGGDFDISPTSSADGSDAGTAPWRVPISPGVWIDVASVKQLHRVVRLGEPAAAEELVRQGFDDCSRFLRRNGHV